MNRSYLLPVTIAAIFVAGCASTDPNSAEARSEKRYVTGSRIPAPEGNSSADVKSAESKEGIDDALRGRNIVVPGKGGPQ
jgi:type IV pilus biogenesis protein CpaD/CtpE